MFFSVRSILVVLVFLVVLLSAAAYAGDLVGRYLYEYFEAYNLLGVVDATKIDVIANPFK